MTTDNMLQLIFLLPELLIQYLFLNIDSTLATRSALLGVLLTFHINELLQCPFIE